MAEIGRRALRGTGLAIGAGSALAACTGDHPKADKAKAFDPHDWESVRAQFALDPGLAHFAAFIFASHPAPVREAIQRHRDALDKDTAGYVERFTEHEEAVRKAAAGYLGPGARPGDVALTDSTTMGMGLLCSGFELRPGQDVLTTEHDFFGTYDALGKLSDRTGATVRRVRLYDDPAAANVGDIVARLRAAIRPRTRLVVVTWVHSSTGVRLPVKAIAAMLADLNAKRDKADHALLAVDGVHGFGAVDTDVTGLGCDFLTSGTHKWLFGPRGTGLLWSRAWDAVAPLIPSFSFPRGPEPQGPGMAATPGGFHSYEHRWALTEAFAFQTAIGRDRIAARIRDQATRLKEGLAGIGSVTVVTPKDPELSAGLVMCRVAALSPREAVDRLRAEHRVVASVTPYDDPLLRFGTSIVTTPEQVDQAVKAVAAIA